MEKRLQTSQIAKLFRARRTGKGKWQAKCPAHRDHTASLEIKEGRKHGTTIVGCYAGCAKADVLAAVGLRISDLFADKMPDREALALAEKMRAQEAREAKAKRRKEREAIDRARKWEACRDALGLLLMQRPGDDKLASLFHWACEQTRDLPPTGYFQPGVDMTGTFPARSSLDGVTAQDVGAQVAKYLRLP
jgi:hypothetical protein